MAFRSHRMSRLAAITICLVAVGVGVVRLQRSAGHLVAVVQCSRQPRSSGHVADVTVCRDDVTAAEKARILAEYKVLGKAGKGALLRREGIYSSLIAAWRQQRDQGVLQALAKPAGRPQADAVDRENVRLRARVARLEADLDKARRVIDVQGKHRWWD